MNQRIYGGVLLTFAAMAALGWNEVNRLSDTGDSLSGALRHGLPATFWGLLLLGTLLVFRAGHLLHPRYSLPAVAAFTVAAACFRLGHATDATVLMGSLGASALAWWGAWYLLRKP